MCDVICPSNLATNITELKQEILEETMSYKSTSDTIQAIYQTMKWIKLLTPSLHPEFLHLLYVQDEVLKQLVCFIDGVKIMEE